MKRALLRLCALSALTLLAAALWAQQDHSAVVGTWNMTSETSDGDLNWVLVVKEADGKMTGTIKAPDATEEELKDFSFSDGNVHFQAPYQGAYYDIDLKLTGKKLDGKWSGDGNSGRTYGTKAP